MVDDTFSLDNYDYYLPSHLIAYEPGGKETDRLLVLDRKVGKLTDRLVEDLIDYVDKDTLVVFNNTKVIPARLLGKKVPSGGRVDCLLVRPLDLEKKRWVVLIKPSHRLKEGQEIIFERRLWARYLGEKIVEFDEPVTYQLLEDIGRMPLPPYIKRIPDRKDNSFYQTVYAKDYGAIASPTAGLHFTKRLLEELEKRVWKLCYVTLHIGYGTFAPIKVADIRKHKMHSEFFSVEGDVLSLLRDAHSKGRKILAIGTTVVRVLETIAESLQQENITQKIEGWTDIYIYPGYKFKMVDMLFTNFHLPKSSLLLLVSAFAGRDNIMQAYQYAISKGYRFFSYGDAMLIV